MNAKVNERKQIQRRNGERRIKENIFVRREGKCSTNGGNNGVEREAD